MDIFRSSLCPSIHPSICPSVRPSIPAGALEETKDRGYSVLRGGSPPFFIWREDTSLIISPVTATNYCWLPGSASTSPRMNGQTQASLSLFFTRLSSRCLFFFYSFYLRRLHSTDMEVARPDTQPLVQTASQDGRGGGSNSGWFMFWTLRIWVEVRNFIERGFIQD